MKNKTSWEDAADWYDKQVGSAGHYYHEHVIFSKLLKLLNLKKGDSLLDLACGQGVLARQLPNFVQYLGIDAAPSLINAAKKYKTACKSTFFIKDVTTNLNLDKKFTHATIILALQNIEDPLKVFQNAHECLSPGGKLLIVLNHPCFRIPRQSSWGVDAQKKLQYRRIDRYYSPLKIPIQTHPGKDASQTYSFHHPLSFYSAALNTAGFSITLIEEWCSDKTSTGSMARMENRSREEFPLFLTLSTVKTI